MQRENELVAIVAAVNFKPEYDEKFVDAAIRYRALRTTGTAVAKVLPPVPRFSKDKNHSAKKQRVIQLLKDSFGQFFGLRAEDSG